MIQCVFADIPLDLNFRHEDANLYFKHFINEKPSGNAADTVDVPLTDIYEWIDEYRVKDDGYTEYSLSVYRVADVLISHHSTVIHAGSLGWKGRAVLFSADSGTGKSTQLKHWMELFGNEVTIINGDKPFLKQEKDGTFMVYPSPWRGKELWGDDSRAVPLGAIILLKQGMENRIEKMEPRKIAPLLMTQFFSRFEDKDKIHLLCRFEENLLNKVPVFTLTNKGDRQSAILTRERLLQEERENGL